MSRALLVIDAQQSFRQRPSWSLFNHRDIADRVGRLVASAREDGTFVIWVLHTEPGTGTVFDPVTGHVRLMEGLEPAGDEPVIRKTSINAFTTTNLAQLLTNRSVHELTICGIRTEQCCETTARLASDLGYDVTFVIDATATSPIEPLDAPSGRSDREVLADPRTLSAEQVVQRTAYALDGRFAEVRTLDQVLGAPARA
jgi:nicotinamidase-related amidase